jgi:hypothetical protein
MGDGRREEEQDSRRGLLIALARSSSPDAPAIVAEARRLGVDLGAGASRPRSR